MLDKRKDGHPKQTRHIYRNNKAATYQQAGNHQTHGKAVHDTPDLVQRLGGTKHFHIHFQLTARKHVKRVP